MSSKRIGGVVLLVAGLVLLLVGMNASHSVADRWSNFFTGHFTDVTVWYILGGGAAALAGLMLVLFGNRAVAA